MCTFYRDTHLFWYECVCRKYDIEICRELVLRKSKSVYHLSRYTNSHRKKKFIKRFVTAFSILFRTKMSTPGDKNSSFPILILYFTLKLALIRDTFKYLKIIAMIFYVRIHTKKDVYHDKKYTF